VEWGLIMRISGFKFSLPKLNGARASSASKSAYQRAAGSSPFASPIGQGFFQRGGVSFEPGKPGLSASLQGLGGRLMNSFRSGVSALRNLTGKVFNSGFQPYGKPQASGNWASQFTGYSYAAPGKPQFTPRPNPYGDGGWASQFTRPQAQHSSAAGGKPPGGQAGSKPRPQGATHQGPKPKPQGTPQGQQSAGSRPHSFQAEQARKQKDALGALGLGHLDLQNLSPSDKAALRKSYLKWSMKNHPDKGGDNALFQSVSGALGDFVR
jgi:hypothetical protein